MSASSPAAFDRKQPSASLRIDGQESASLRIAGTVGRRLRGMFFSDIEALLIVPCNSVHAIGFSKALEVAYLDQDGHVVALKKLKPWTMHMPVKGAFCALEALPGVFERWGLTDESTVSLAAPPEEASPAAESLPSAHPPAPAGADL